MSRIDWKEKLGWNETHLEELRNIGYSYVRQGKYTTALPLFEALVILDPESAYDAQTLGAIYVQINDPKNAIKALTRALQLETDHAPTLMNLTKAFLMNGDVDEGLRLANILKNDNNPFIAGTAAALVLTYGKGKRPLRMETPTKEQG